MIKAPTKHQPLVSKEWVTAEQSRGRRLLDLSDETIWVKYERFAFMRYPHVVMGAPSERTLKQLFWDERSLMVSYLDWPSSATPANAVLYLCKDTDYHLEKLPKNARRDIRRGQRHFRVEPISWDAVLDCGQDAFIDTRKRHQFADANRVALLRRYAARKNWPCYVAWGAWYQDMLAAWISLDIVGDWIEIEGSYSLSSLLNYCPNNVLLYTIVHRYLVEQDYSQMSYGLSSVQTTSSVSGLHAYKNKMGFQSMPVVRKFLLHPVLRPLSNPYVVRIAKSWLQKFPTSRRARKALGVMETLSAGRVWGGVCPKV